MYGLFIANIRRNNLQLFWGTFIVNEGAVSISNIYRKYNSMYLEVSDNVEVWELKLYF